MKYMAAITDGNDLVPGGLTTPDGHRECASKCLSTIGCNSWTFASFNNSCFLKSDEIDWKMMLRWPSDWKKIGMERTEWKLNWVSGSKACGSFCKYPYHKDNYLNVVTFKKYLIKLSIVNKKNDYYRFI